MSQVRRQIIDLFTAPFRLDPADLLTLSIPQQERRRQRALLRLVIGSVMTLLVVVALPLVIPTHVSPAVLGSIAGIFVVSGICLWLLRQGWVEVAGSLFITAFLVTVALSIVLRDPHGLTLESILSYGYFLLVLLIAGLILPDGVWL